MLIVSKIKYTLEIGEKRPTRPSKGERTLSDLVLRYVAPVFNLVNDWQEIMHS